MFGIKMRALQKDGGSDLDSGAMFTYKVGINLKRAVWPWLFWNTAELRRAGPVIESAQRSPNRSLDRAPPSITTMTILSYPLKHRDAAEPMPGESKLIDRVRVVHAQVNGRARLQIDGLYHCEPIRRRVESALAREAGIRQVSANVLTGRVLVLYDPARTVDEIKRRVEELLANPSPPPSEQRPPSNLYPLRPVKPMVSTDGSAAPAQGATQWHTLTRTAVLKALETTKERGLSPASAKQKLRRYGANSLPQTRPVPR